MTSLGVDAVPAATIVPDYPDRMAVRDQVAQLLVGRGVRWAWQGAADAPDVWCGQTGSADLDIWWDPSPQVRAAVVRALVSQFGGAIVGQARTPGRLMHLGVAFQTPTGLALVDLTEGDLRVGPVLMVPAAEVTVAGQRLTGVAGAADMALRPVLRGRLPKAERLVQAQAAWADAAADDRARAAANWRGQLGAVADRVVEMLEGAAADPGLPRAARLALARATLTPATLPEAWRQRHSILPAGRHAGPLGARTHGVVVALVGTDGSGKSTVARNLAARLETAGFQTREAYFGMAHGNLPGVALARRVLGVGAAGDRATAEQGVKEPAAPSQSPGSPRDHAAIRQLAAWFYAAEYQWRYLSQVAPARRRGAVVICDRYVYDLRESPWPGSPAARVAQWLMPAPDLLVLPDAPAALIHARKPERSLAEQEAQQLSFRLLLAERPARVAELIVDTSGSDPHPELPVAAAVIAAAHDPQRLRASAADPGPRG